MKIADLTTGQGNVDVEGTVSEIGETRTFSRFGKDLSVANTMLKDDSGAVKLTLWNEDVTRFKEGDKVKVTNGYVNEFQGEKQLTSGKFGKIELAEGTGTSEEPAEQPAEESAEPASEEPAEQPAEESAEPASEEPETESTPESTAEPEPEEEPKEPEETTF